MLTQAVIDALDVGSWLRRWGDSGRRASHLDAIVQLARDYEDQTAEEGTAATLSGLITHFDRLADAELDTRLCPYGLDAVTLLTYHKAKGSEWPVVVLTELESQREPDLWSPAVIGGAPTEEYPLTGRSIRYWQWPFGWNPMFPSKVVKGSGVEFDALESPEGVAESSKNERESLRLLYVGFTRACNKLILSHRDAKYDWLKELPDIDVVLNPALDTGEYPLPEIDTTYRVRQLEPPNAEEFKQSTPSDERWLKTLILAPPFATSYQERFWSPSESETIERPSVAIEPLPGPAVFPTNLPAEKEAALGKVYHAYIACLNSVSNLERPAKENVALRLLKGFGVEGHVAADDIVKAGERFREWLHRKHPGATWFTEVPGTAPRAGGGQWVGIIDMLGLLDHGDCVLIDHKALPLRRDQCEAKALTYWGQLNSYREILGAQSLKVKEAWIHFPLAGIMALVGSVG
jgi:ATP-dependent exoDNAse (exonuclease V) beta subunit